MEDDQAPEPTVETTDSGAPPETPKGAMEKMAGVFSTVPEAPELGQGTMEEKHEKTWAMFAHLSALGLLMGIPFANIIGPLVIYLLKKDDSKYVAEHAKEALNFHISFYIWTAATAVLAMIFIPFGLLIGAWGILAIISTIMGSIKANEGNFMGMPFTLRIIK